MRQEQQRAARKAYRCEEAGPRGCKRTAEIARGARYAYCSGGVRARKLIGAAWEALTPAERLEAADKAYAEWHSYTKPPKPCPCCDGAYTGVEH